MHIRLTRGILLTALIVGNTNLIGANNALDTRELSFDAGWRFLRADASGADAPGFDDSAWRLLDLPHDWSIDDLPSTNGAPPSPFDPALSAGGPATGYVVGGIGWYRKHFTLPPSASGKTVTILFDGVYMNSDVWFNGRHLGNHPYGYTPFVYDLTPYLKPAGQENVIAVQVKNTGRNSRWYSGSGIYRHVWLNVTDPVHVPVWGVCVVTTNLSKSIASVSVSTTIQNDRGSDVSIRLRAHLVGPNGRASGDQETEVNVPADKQEKFTVTLEFSVTRPVLWSLDNPALYRAEVELVDGSQVIDHSGTTFGIRTLEFSADKGFLLNGEPVKLKGGCMHHDNGPLGAAAIDRAEERRVQRMKAYGYNAIRTSHNPPSPQFLDACDRYGVLVIDEAFDCWERGKNPDDYHVYFDDWWRRDLRSMILRDRNHPSVILWSIGNEINERAEPVGVAISRKMIEAIRPLDTTRPVTEAICGFWDHAGKNWSDTAAAFAALDVGGYNYERQEYIRDHNHFPSRIMVGTESDPCDVSVNWQAVLNDPWVIGDFEWTSWDYMGETGIGNAKGGGFTMPFPWYVSNCGDIDICGFEKPPHAYRAVVWGDARIAIAVHAPIPAGHTEKVSPWGWPEERQSWTWPGCEGTPLDVKVYSSCQSVRLELDGKEIATEPVNDQMVARFHVPYHAGELRAVGLTDGKAVASATLRTAGNPEKIRLTADRSAIHAERNDLSYVQVEVIDRNGDVVPTATVPIHFTVSGAGELTATGNGAPDDSSSFHLPVRKTYEGRCLAILRPEGGPGKITLKAEADGLKPATLVIKTR